MTDFTKSPAALITELINQANGSALAAADLVFGTPQVNSAPGAKRNTLITVTGKANSAVTGSAEFQYDRIDINEIAGEQSRVFTKGSRTLVSELVALINQAYAINLTASEYQEAPLSAMGGPGTLEIKPGSLVYRGSLNYVLAIG